MAIGVGLWAHLTKNPIEYSIILANFSIVIKEGSWYYVS